MSNSLPKCRIGNNCNFALTLKDSGVSVNWSTVTIRQIFMYSLAQKAWGGKCTYHVDASDGKKLKVTYPASQQMYTGDMRIVIQIAYQGNESTFDALAVNIVPLTEDVTGDTTIEAEDIEVGIEVSDLSTSVISEILEACQIATKNANASKAACDTATSNANTATSACTTATSNANTATSACTTATSNANTKANLADQKASLANEKANLANEKATLADTKATYANTQGEYAKAKGDEAKAATTSATNAATSATNAASSATSAAESANNAASSATSAASAANSAATNANNKVTELNGYATRLGAVEGKTTSISHSGNETKVNDDLRVETRILINEDNEGEDLEIKAELDQDDYKMIMKLGSASMGDNGAIVRHILTPKENDDATPKSYVDNAVSSASTTLGNRIGTLENKTSGISKDASGNTLVDNNSIEDIVEYLGAVMVKTTKISYANNKTTIDGVLAVNSDIRCNFVGGYDNNSHYVEFGENESTFFDADGNAGDVKVNDILFSGNQSLIEIASKVNNLVVIDNESV